MDPQAPALAGHGRPSGSLDGLRVLDFSRLLPGPFCSLLLADLGADVVKVEDVQSGDYLRWMPPHVGDVNVSFAWVHRGKRSACLNLRHPEGLAAARRLALRADVLIESYRPGVIAGMGLDYATLSADHPGLVYCSLTGYGQDGPLAARAGHDLGYMARSGAASVTGTRDGTPVVCGLQVADLGGAMGAALAIVAAVVGRQRTGRGAHLDLSLTDAAMSLLALQGAEALHTGIAPRPGQGLLAGAYPCYRFYLCADGRWLSVSAIEPKFWTRLCETLDLPDLVGDGMAQGARRDEVERRLEERFATRGRDDWMGVFDAIDCCVDPVLDVNEAFDSPNATARGMRVEAVAHDGTPLPQPGSPLRRFATPPAAAPALGAHTRDVLLEAGLTEEDIARLATDGACHLAPST